MWNLLRNAADAAPPAASTSRSRCARDGARSDASIAVSDDGKGIPPSSSSRIFDPFCTTKQKGTGLGLATCHAIVAEHGGRIDVESELGKGTKMVVTLPRPVKVGSIA